MIMMSDRNIARDKKIVINKMTKNIYDERDRERKKKDKIKKQIH